MINTEAFKLRDKLKKLNKSMIPPAISRKVAKNIDRLDQECRYITDAIIKIRENYAQKDESGDPLIENNEYVYENESVREQCIREQNDFMGDECKVELEKVTEAELNKLDESERYDVLTVEQNAALLAILE